MTQRMVILICPHRGANPDLAHPVHPVDHIASKVNYLLSDLLSQTGVAIFLEPTQAEIDLLVDRRSQAGPALARLLRFLHEEFSQDPRTHPDIDIRFCVEPVGQLAVTA